MSLIYLLLPQLNNKCCWCFERTIAKSASATAAFVLQVQEFFGDFVVMDPQHFCIPLPRSHVVLQPFSWDYANSTDAVTRMTEGLASLTLSLRRRFNIRSVILALPQHSMPLKNIKGQNAAMVLHECSAKCMPPTTKNAGKSC